MSAGEIVGVDLGGTKMLLGVPGSARDAGMIGAAAMARIELEQGEG